MASDIFLKNVSVKRTVFGLILPAVILVAWFYVTTFGSVPSSILPDIPRVGRTVLNMIDTGQLQEDLFVSLSRVIKGYLVSAVLGIVLGSLMGMFENIKLLLLPVVTVIRQIPMIAWIPLIILWCGIGKISKMVIIGGFFSNLGKYTKWD